MTQQSNYLDKLQSLSRQRNDGGLIHSGVIHYIQQKFEELYGGGFVLKAAIYQVLENVPDVFPLNLKELIDDDDWKPSDKMNKVFQDINSNLILPIGGGEIIEIIRLAQEYEAA